MAGLHQFQEDALGVNVSLRVADRLWHGVGAAVRNSPNGPCLAVGFRRSIKAPTAGKSRVPRVLASPSPALRVYHVQVSCASTLLQSFLRLPPTPQSMYKSYTRLPAQLLLDPSPDGPLAIIAAACGEHIKAKGLKRIDWIAPQSRKEVGGEG